MMLIGINHPWHNYGWDFGPPVEHRDGSQPTVTRWDSPLPKPMKSAQGRQLNTLLDWQLDDYEQNGIQAVRWILLGDGWNLGTPKLNSSGQWDYTPPDARAQGFTRDFETVLKAFQKTKLKLLPCLINHPFFFPAGAYAGKDSTGHPRPEVRFKPGVKTFDDFMKDFYLKNPGTPYDPAEAVEWNKFVKGAKGAVVATPESRKEFFDKVLQPFLYVSSNYSDLILAWELISEPDFVVSKYVSPKNMLDFVMEGVELILQYQFRATIGFQKQSTFGQMWGSAKDVQILTGLTKSSLFIPQVHYYPEYGQAALSPVKSSEGYMVGEFGTSFDDDSKKNSPAWPAWPGEKTKSIAYRLNLIKGLNYSSAFLWSGNTHDGISNWDAAARADVKNFPP